MKIWMAGFAAVMLALPFGGSVAVAADQVDPALYGALQWRNVGPFRGGRVTAVEGVPSQPRTFYFGATGGGVWKTTDGGVNWKNISDGSFNTGSVGAIAVALSDPNVVYVGMGEHGTRGVTTSHGDGVYKSTDGGRSWAHMGLAATRHISQIRIHPQNPDMVYVGAQGSPWGPNPERGVFRSRDGGASWDKVLYANPRTGVNDLAMDPTNPRILYAALWEHQRKPWHGYQMTSGGPGSGLHKSTDGGDSWTKLTGGLPTPAGKYAITVSPARPDRLWALVEAKPGQGGVYRSDNGGASWAQVNGLHVMTERSAYYMHIFADPGDAETVYVLNAPAFKSTDGGVTYQRMATPHGDNHDLWIHPQNSDWMIEGNDGGANVSFDGGKSWSTQGNQPTAQFYRVITDNLFPYNIYGGQQDNTTVAIASRTFGNGIGVRDWHPVGGGESAHVAFDRDNPALIYAGSYQGNISEYESSTGRVRNIMHYPMRAAFRQGKDYPYRFNWNAPILVSRHDPSVIYHAANVVLKSTDRGQSWSEISPDLTRDDPARQGVVEGEFTFEGTAGEMYNTIFALAESPLEAGTLWVGSDDGLIHITRDGGATWDDVTPRGLGETQINMIEASPHDPAAAYIVATRYKFNDFQPRIYGTKNYGRTWSRRNDGIAKNTFVRVVREDPEQRGLLYAGTEAGMYVSFNDGRDWQSLQLNLPAVPVTDLRIKGNDLVISTQGRAFWVLDDISPLRQLNAQTAKADLFLFAPAATARVAVGGYGPRGPGQNPPTGSLFYYRLKDVSGLAAGDLRLEILDHSGTVVAGFDNRPAKKRKDRLVAWYRKGAAGAVLAAKAGLNRFVWDWRRRAIGDYPPLATYRGRRNYRAAPGLYTARLSLGEDQVAQTFEVRPDPRGAAAPEDYQAQQEQLAGVWETAQAIQTAIVNMARVRADIARAVDLVGGEVVEPGKVLTARIDDWEHAVIESRNPNYIDALHSPTRLDFNMLSILQFLDAMDPPITLGAERRMEDLLAEWGQRQTEMESILGPGLADFNQTMAGMKMPAISASGGE